VIVVGVVAAVRAVAYRELIWFRRFIGEYIVAWIAPLVFTMAAILLPAAISGTSMVSEKLSSILGVKVSFHDAIVYGIALSAILSLVAAVVNDIIQAIAGEVKFVGVMDTILEAIGLRSYLTAVALVRPLALTILSTLYLAPVLSIVLEPLKGLILYAMLLPGLVLSGIALGGFALAIGVVVAFYTRISRPWIVPNTLVPALLAGSGIYVPLSMVPLVLRVIALASPVPEACELVKLVSLTGASPELASYMAIIAFLYTIYISVSSILSRSSEWRLRRGG